jgi:hypothetical protein
MASPLTLRLDEKTRKLIVRIARRKQVSTSEVVRQAIEAWVDRQEPVTSSQKESAYSVRNYGWGLGIAALVSTDEKCMVRRGRLRAMTNGCSGYGGDGVLVTEATDCPVCASTLYHGSGRRNRAFTLIWCQVFPLAATRGPSSGMGMKVHPWMDARAAISIGAFDLAFSLASRQGTAERRSGWQGFRT